MAGAGLLPCAGLFSLAVAQQATPPAPLPPLSVEAKKPVPQKKVRQPPQPPPWAPPPPAAPTLSIPAPNAKGDIGYDATRTPTATKTDTPLRNVPQSVSVVTDQQIRTRASKASAM